ncbi:MAG TPA: hypothetical protein VKA46_01410 [Gemmataceae bacterium]|nr:hypothetical protein [Gemmataceae bacterium]
MPGTANFIRTSSTGSAPSLADLFGFARRTVSELFAACGVAPPAVDVPALRDAAERVRLVDQGYEPFVRPHWSNRSREHFTRHGITGGGTYADVPLALVLD